mmetsp:Transcript_11572/g.34732  ORF Transcript_11572/g.34732 Transcript_11572/m.34732 type:complete len:175 (-) Transcript_11572:15-539(-)
MSDPDQPDILDAASNAAASNGGSDHGSSGAASHASSSATEASGEVQKSPFAAVAYANPHDRPPVASSHTASTGLGTTIGTPATDTTLQHGFGSQNGTETGGAGSNSASQLATTADGEAGVGSSLEDRPHFASGRRHQKRTVLRTLQGSGGPTGLGMPTPASSLSTGLGSNASEV